MTKLQVRQKFTHIRHSLSIGHHRPIVLLGCRVPDLVAGVDAGGTTRCLVVARDGRVAGSGSAAGANIRSSPGLPQQRFARALAARLAGALRVVTDLDVAFAAGSPRTDGLLLLAGTGAAAASFVARRIARRCDGYGWLLGDEGSAVWLGLRGVRAALAAHFGADPDGDLAQTLIARSTPTDRARTERAGRPRLRRCAARRRAARGRAACGRQPDAPGRVVPAAPLTRAARTALRHRVGVAREPAGRAPPRVSPPARRGCPRTSAARHRRTGSRRR